MYKFVARHDGGETSGDSTCFGANTQWWTDKGMFTAGPDLKIGDGDGEEKVGYVFMENECDTMQNDKPQDSQNPCRTVNCLVEPAYVASYAPYGRAAVTGSWKYTSNTAAPTTWATTTRVFELDISQFQLDTAGSSGGDINYADELKKNLAEKSFREEAPTRRRTLIAQKAPNVPLP